MGRPIIEFLPRRIMLAGDPLSNPKLAQDTYHVDDSLLNLFASAQAGQNIGQASSAGALVVDADRRVAVTIRADDVHAVSRALAAIGFEPTASYPTLHFVEGVIPVASLESAAGVAASTGRFDIQPIYDPVLATGSVNSQADYVLEANRVRATLPASINGAGQRVGVLSDSYNSAGTASADIASGDLPASLAYLVDSGGTDEGRAMLQLIYDLAPAATLAFATANGGEGTFAQHIRDLANPALGNSTVIVDDVSYFAEPMFQDGVIAQAIDDVVTSRGVNYFSAAGNQASEAYESTNFTTAADTITRSSGSAVSGNFYDFDPSSGVDTRQRITVPAGGTVTLEFQYDQPFYTSAGVTTDLDLFLINPATGKIVKTSEGDNISSQTPTELVTYRNPSSTTALPLDVAILNYSGPNPGRIKYVNYGSDITINEFKTDSPTVIPHAAATNGQAVGAVPYFIQDQSESFTSKGPSTILFSPAGARIPTQVRQTPQIASVDGINTTFFGSPDFEGDGYKNFFGTSAAAPHAAAVAALVRQANPSLTAAQVYTRLQTTADDINAAGFDNLSGNGLINAFDAVYPNITPAATPFADGFESGALSTSYETRSTGAGRIFDTTANSPANGSFQLTLDASNPPIGFVDYSSNEVTLHADLSAPGTKSLSFTEKEFNDDDDPMPATFSGSSNSDGVAVSIDGVNWLRLISLTGANSTNTYSTKTFDLSAFATGNGIVLGSDTRIRF